VIASGLAGVAALALVTRSRFAQARYAAAVAVAAIVAGWGLAQQPGLLPGLTVKDAAAPRDTLVAIVVAVVAGGAILLPSLVLLLRLSLGGQLGYDAGDDGGAAETGRDRDREPPLARGTMRAGRAALTCLLGGFAFLTVAEAGWAHAIGVVLVLGALAAGVAAATPALLDPPVPSD
jgi:cytochrome d ubiquinol oxidase subunit II